MFWFGNYLDRLKVRVRYCYNTPCVGIVSKHINAWGERVTPVSPRRAFPPRVAFGHTHCLCAGYPALMFVSYWSCANFPVFRALLTVWSQCHVTLDRSGFNSFCSFLCARAIGFSPFYFLIVWLVASLIDASCLLLNFYQLRGSWLCLLCHSVHVCKTSGHGFSQCNIPVTRENTRE